MVPPPAAHGVSVSLAKRLGAPPALFSDHFLKTLSESPPLPETIFADPKFTAATTDKNGRRLPQTIAHRGYKAEHPENTMGAFKGAVKVGAHGLETDVHITKDDVVVLSHDATLQRCFGVDKKILDCDWKEISDLRTLREPHEPMPRLQDLIEYLAQPELSKTWLMLDIKIDNNADDIMRLMSKVIKSIEPPEGTRWEDRIILGCWAAKFIPLCEKYFAGFPVTNIGFSVAYSRQFFAVPHVSFNMLQACLVSPSGRKFIRDAKALERKVYSWTVNDEKNMDWCIRRELDGVITDDPKKFLEVCERFDPMVAPPPWPWLMIINFIRINIFAWIFGWSFWGKHGFNMDKRFTSANGK